ncbi:hypothetical protein [Tenacibaculum sp. C7A-26P2]|uniref:hypothetical protein n=1 Tax=Tenacibaculum sp. C7A-26P2 TaxID=3447504 RepID=UPI003F8289E7
MKNSKVQIGSSIEVATQSPLDGKTMFLTLDEMRLNIEINAFKYYEDMVVRCIKTHKEYIWRETKQSDKISDKVLRNDFTYPDGAIAFGINYSNRKFNFFEKRNGDDLGDHTATQNLDMAGYRIINVEIISPKKNSTVRILGHTEIHGIATNYVQARDSVTCSTAVMTGTSGVMIGGNTTEKGSRASGFKIGATETNKVVFGLRHSDYAFLLDVSGITSKRSLTVQDKDGTVAHLDDIMNTQSHDLSNPTDAILNKKFPFDKYPVGFKIVNTNPSKLGYYYVRVSENQWAYEKLTLLGANVE